MKNKLVKNTLTPSECHVADNKKETKYQIKKIFSII